MTPIKHLLISLVFMLCLFASSFANITDQLSFSLNDFDTLTSLAPDSNYYTRITCDLPKQVVADTSGDPWLPALTYAYSLPQGMKIDYVTVDSYDTTLLAKPSHLVYPRQEPMMTCIDCEAPEFVPPGSTYQQSSFPLSADLALCTLPINFSHGMGLGVIQLRPVIYDIADNELWLITNVSLTIHLTAAGSQPRSVSSRSVYSHNVVMKYLKGIVRNYGDVDGNTPTIQTFNYNYPVDPDDIPPDYVIVTNTSNQFAQELIPFKYFKTSYDGCKVEIFTLEDDIYPNYDGRDNPEKLRNFIIDKYTDGAIYVLLAGNMDVVPVRYAHPERYNGSVPADSQAQIISDLYYACLEGDWDGDGDDTFGEYFYDGEGGNRIDVAADIFVGRVAISQPGHATTWIEKHIRYEVEPGYGSTSYLSNVMISSADQMADIEYAGNQPQAIADEFSPFFNVDTETFREQPSPYDPNPTSPTGIDVTSYLSNPSCGYYFSLSHADPEWFTTMTTGCNNYPRWGVTTWPALMPWLPEEADTIHSVELEGREYIHSSIGCHLGCMDVLYFWDQDYHYDFCYAEKCLFIEGGPFAGTFNTRIGWCDLSFRIEAARIELLCETSYIDHRFGPAHYGMKSNYTSCWRYRTITYDNTLFGDPEFTVYTDNPRQFVLEHPESVELDSTQTITVRVLDSLYTMPLPNVLVTLSKQGEIYERGYTDASGRVYLTVNPTTGGNISVSCDRSNYIVNNGSIDVNTYCADAVAGDVNGDGFVIGSDVIYATNYFRGSGPPPPDSCMCPDEYLYHAADANGNCVFIGSDITYLLNYFRGGSAPLFCQDCPVGELILLKRSNITDKVKTKDR